MSQKRLMRRINLGLKRFFDIIVSAAGLLILSPVFLLIVLLIKITMPGKIFFQQERVGKGKKVFHILKFRTMKEDRQAEEAHDFSKDAERMTRTGNILRRLKIDELPQLWNVFAGDMSLVGPRPTVMEQVEQYDEFQLRRLGMLPGMTGLAQVNGNVSLSWNERIKYDVRYIEKFSVVLDLAIMIKTVLVVIFGEQKFKKECGWE